MLWSDSLDPLVTGIATAWLAVLMLHAGQAKLRDRLLLVQHLAAYRVPDNWLTFLSIFVPLGELTSGIGLLTPWRSSAAAGCAALLLLYATVMAWHLRAGRSLDCGCGGEPLPLSWALVFRNVLLSLLCWPASWPMLQRAFSWVDLVLILSAVLLGVLIWAVFHQVLRHSRRTSMV
jgi:uncharacterized membrane protein YphA (DoxX/SURF4 family)